MAGCRTFVICVNKLVREDANYAMRAYVRQKFKSAVQLLYVYIASQFSAGPFEFGDKTAVCFRFLFKKETWYI